MSEFRPVVTQPEQRLQAAVGQLGGDLERRIVRHRGRNQTVQQERALQRGVAAYRKLSMLTSGRRLGRSFRRLRQILVLAFRNPAVHPAYNQLQLFRRKRLVIAKIPEPLDGAPWWHAARKHLFLDCYRPGTAF